MPWFSAPSVRGTTPDRDELVQEGLGAVHNYLYFSHEIAPPGGWQNWLRPALAHCYSQTPHLALLALRVLDQALVKVASAVDVNEALNALCWTLAQSDRSVRDLALFVAIRHRALLSQVDEAALSQALQRFTPPPSISSSWMARIATLPIESG
jgi:hypothetical protein